MPRDDFRNFLIIQKMEEDKEKRTIIGAFYKNKWLILVGIIFVLLVIFFYRIFFVRVNLTNLENENDLFQINNGESVSYIADRLKSNGVIRSKDAFKIYMRVFSGKNVAQAGIYKFNQKDNLISIANKIIGAHYAIPPIKITIPEGSDNGEIAKLIQDNFSNEVNTSQLVDDFSKESILVKIKDKEGYLFPDTYLFLPNANLEQVIAQMSNKFYDNLKNIFENESKELGIYSLDVGDFKLKDFFDDETKTVNLKKRFTIISEVGTTTVTIKDIITMASYLEGEANNEKDMKIVAGVLWTRLKLNYPLQIDAATSTYKSKGFTATPINNPGLVAIRAAISPTNLGYIYYITGNDGNMYYAKDYDTHLYNINKHLRNGR